MKKVVIMRGIPGSGKSTFVKTYFPGATVCSTDAYFVVNGEYRFDPSKLSQAHEACWSEFFDALARGDELIVVDNTNIRLQEIASCVLPAEAMGYEVGIITVEADCSECADRNLHSVPERTIERQYRDLLAHSELFPPFWKHTIVGWR